MNNRKYDKDRQEIIERIIAIRTNNIKNYDSVADVRNEMEIILDSVSTEDLTIYLFKMEHPENA